MFLEHTFVYFVTAFTSVLVFFLSVNQLGLKMTSLRQALRDTVECIGAFIVFLIANLTVAVTAIFMIRGVWHFFPLYTVADVGLFMLSAFQGFVFHLWWRRSRQQ